MNIQVNAIDPGIMDTGMQAGRERPGSGGFGKGSS